jgi:hypothetical protein
MPTCKKCGQEIHWIKTKAGKNIMIQVDGFEPHYPHCGKNLWTEADWERYREEIKLQTIRNNTETEENQFLITNPLKKKSFYQATRPPWEYETFIDCLER